MKVLESTKSHSFPIIFFPALVILLSASTMAFAQEAATAPVDYRDVPIIGSRNLIWIFAQVHLLFGGFVLAVPLFAWICEIVGVWTKEKKYDDLAKEFTNLLTVALEMTALVGSFLLFFLLVLYPKVMNYLTDIFLPTYYVYVLMFVGSTALLYLYWSGFETMQRRKGLHLFVGLLLNLVSFAIMIIPNAWATFQTSPVVLAEGMGVWEKAWAAMNNPTWWPVNIHRFIGNIVLGGFICGAYAGIRFLGAKNEEERAHYDWMGYIGNFIGLFGFLPLPFAGYWLTREIYMYNQQMGITLMGGFLSWLFILQAILIGVLFLGANYYFWLGLSHRLEGGGERYKKPIVSLLVVLVLGFAVWLTPHSLVASLQEARAMGGAHHPVLGVLGVMSAKMTAVNIMILMTFISFLIYWRAGKQESVGWAKTAKVFMALLFGAAILGVIGLGVWGYFVPAIVRINKFSVWQVLLVLFVLVTVIPLMGAMLRNAKLTSKMVWGRMPARSQYILIFLAVDTLLLMSMMGYARSAARIHWHIYGVLEDTSPYAFSPTLGYAGFYVALSTLVFCLLVAFIFWVIQRTVRYPAFSTQYFFFAPFIMWLVSLPEKLAALTPPVSKPRRYFRKAVAVTVGFLIVFLIMANKVPQLDSQPPKKAEFDPTQIATKADVVKIGSTLFFSKGQCALCHTIGPSEAPRAPNLEGIGAHLTREFFYESLTKPQAYLYKIFETEGGEPPLRFPAVMPVITKPPVGLSEGELLCVIAFLQSLGGEVTVEPEEVKALMLATLETGTP